MNSLFQQLKQRHESQLEALFHPNPTDTLTQAMRYSCLNGGKRLRPMLVYLAGRAFDIPLLQLDAAALSVELVHCYSLVHDDLPAMDDDDLRRGKATCHVAYDQGTAILVGDALQSLAFEVLCQQNLEPSAIIRMVQTLSQAIGHQGMALGQAIDISVQNKTISLDELRHMHRLKTGALLKACVELAICAAPTPCSQKSCALQDYVNALGLAFQIQDDILDVESSTEILGKDVGKDAKLNKPSYAKQVGLQQAKLMAKEAFIEADDALKQLGEAGLELQAFSSNIQCRDA